MPEITFTTAYGIIVISASITVYLVANRIKVPEGEIHFLLNGQDEITTMLQGDAYQFWPVIGLFIMNLPAKKFAFSEGDFPLNIPRMEVFDKDHHTVHIDIDCSVRIINEENLKEYFIPGTKKKLRSIIVKMIYRILGTIVSRYKSNQLAQQQQEIEKRLLRTLKENLDIYGVLPVKLDIVSIIF